MADLWLIVFLVGVPIGFCLYSKGKTRIFWLVCLAGMVAVLGGCEAYCKFVDTDHLTLSQRFAALPDGSQIAIAILMFVGWVGLLLHLTWKLLVRKWNELWKRS